MPSHLPVELLRLILDQFDTSPHSDADIDYSTLNSLCLTAKAFRRIAQPKFFTFVVVEEKDAERTLSKLVKNNKSNGLLTKIRFLALAESDKAVSETDSDDREEEEKEDLFSVTRSLLRDLSRACTNLEYLVCESPVFDIAVFSSAGIRKLCLHDANVADCESTFLLPSLEYLSLINTSFPMKAFTLANFPKLQHLAYSDDRGGYFSDTVDNLAQLASRVHTVILFFDPALLVLDSMPTFPLDSLLIDFPRDLLSFFQHAANKVKHVRIGGFSIGDTTTKALAFVNALDEVTSIISDPSKSSKLESIYLPPLEAFDTRRLPTITRPAINRLLLACQNRKIEVVYEEQPEGISATTQFSEEFIRRKTKERMQREALENEGGNAEGQA